MAEVYEALPSGFQQRIDDRKVIQSYKHFNRAYSAPTNKVQKRGTQGIAQPMVRTHPLLKRKSLYICSSMMTRILGLSESKSKEILDKLSKISGQLKFYYVYDWQPSDDILWDNARTMHQRDPFDAQHRRLMKRTTILVPAELAEPFVLVINR